MTQFHIGIGNSHELRKSLLESLKAVVGSLQEYDQFLQYRREREEEILKLRRLMREIGMLNARLGSEMPRSREAPRRPLRPAPAVRGKQQEVTSEGAKRLSKISQVSRLAKRLAAIEDDLKRME